MNDHTKENKLIFMANFDYSLIYLFIVVYDDSMKPHCKYWRAGALDTRGIKHSCY